MPTAVDTCSPRHVLRDCLHFFTGAFSEDGPAEVDAAGAMLQDGAPLPGIPTTWSLNQSVPEVCMCLALWPEANSSSNRTSALIGSCCRASGSGAISCLCAARHPCSTKLACAAYLQQRCYHNRPWAGTNPVPNLLVFMCLPCSCRSVLYRSGYWSCMPCWVEAQTLTSFGW